MIKWDSISTKKANKLSRISQGQLSLEIDAMYPTKLRTIKICNFRPKISFCSPFQNSDIGRIAQKEGPNKLWR